MKQHKKTHTWILQELQIFIYIYVSVKTYRYCICIENIDIKHQFKVHSKKISISTEIEKNRTIHTYGPSVSSALEHLPIAPQHRLCEACSSLVTCRFLLSLTARSIYLAKLWKFHPTCRFPWNKENSPYYFPPFGGKEVVFSVAIIWPEFMYISLDIPKKPPEIFDGFLFLCVFWGGKKSYRSSAGGPGCLAMCIYIYIHISPNKDLIVSRNGRSKKKTKKKL